MGANEVDIDLGSTPEAITYFLTTFRMALVSMRSVGFSQNINSKGARNSWRIVWKTQSFFQF